MSLARAYGRRNLYETQAQLTSIANYVDSDGTYFIRSGKDQIVYQFAHKDPATGNPIPQSAESYTGGNLAIIGSKMRYKANHRLNPTESVYTPTVARVNSMESLVVIEGVNLPDGRLAGRGDTTWDKTNGFWLYYPTTNANVSISNPQNFSWTNTISFSKAGVSNGTVYVGVACTQNEIRFPITNDQRTNNVYKFGWANAYDSELVDVVFDSDNVNTRDVLIHLYEQQELTIVLTEPKTVRVWATGGGGSGGGRTNSNLVAGSGGGGAAFVQATANLPVGTYRLVSGAAGERYLEQKGGKSGLFRVGDSETIISAGGGFPGSEGWGAAGGAGGTWKVSNNPEYTVTVSQFISGGRGGAAAASTGLNAEAGQRPTPAEATVFTRYQSATTYQTATIQACGGGGGGTDGPNRAGNSGYNGGLGGYSGALAGGGAGGSSTIFLGYGGGGGGKPGLYVTGTTALGGGQGSLGSCVLRFET